MCSCLAGARRPKGFCSSPRASLTRDRFPTEPHRLKRAWLPLRAVFAYGVQSALEATRRAIALEPERTSPWTAVIRFGLGSSSYLSGEISLARKQFEGALELIGAGQPLLRMVTLAYLSIVAADEGNLEEAESLAREAGALVDRFELQGVPQSSWAPIALGYFLAKRGDLVEAQTALERRALDTKEAARSESLARPHRVARARSGALRTRRPRRGSGDARLRRELRWRGIPTPVYSPSFSSARSANFARASRGWGNSAMSLRNASSMCLGSSTASYPPSR